MKARYRLVTRGSRGGTFYCFDKETKKRQSLHTTNEDDARQIVEAKNNAERQPVLNLQIAKVYLAGSDSGASTRTWQQALNALIENKHGANKDRWKRAVRDKAINLIRNLPIIETKAEMLFNVLHAGTVSTNVFLRQLHNFCVDMNWLPWPLIPKRHWPPIRYQEKRAITLDEHLRIVEREKNAEFKAFYQLAWHLGASQSDLAHLQAEDVDWSTQVISFFRMKTRWRGQQPPQIRFGKEVEEILAALPKTGPLFPKLILKREKHRAKEFKRRCVGLGIEGISLHSYRYAWAERAKAAGYPERYAQLALGHNSKAVHRAYAKKATVLLPPLEDYERKIIQFNGAAKAHNLIISESEEAAAGIDRTRV
jgi:integrase